MQVNNPTNVDRLCPQLSENLAPYGVRAVADGFVKCEECRCVVFGDEALTATPEPEVEPAEEPVEAAE